MSSSIQLKQDDSSSNIISFNSKAKETLESIRSSLKKQFYLDIDQVEEHILEVIQNYSKQNLFDHDYQQECTNFVDRLFEEARQILIDKDKGNLPIKAISNKIRLKVSKQKNFQIKADNDANEDADKGV